MHAPQLRSLPDRVRQALLFELIGLVLITPLFVWISGEPLLLSISMLAAISLIAALWNGIYCTAFDWLEGRHSSSSADQRPQSLRIAHALGFEGGLMLLTLPVIMAWIGMDFWTALVADLGLALCYAAFAYLFNLAYDRIFPISQRT